MDILQLDNGLKAINQTGVTLNLEEKMQLKLALLKLEETCGMEELLFWGKITGTAKDYYIALGLVYSNQYEFPRKKFYYCSSATFIFTELPELNKQHVAIADGMDIPFSGDAERILKQLEKEREEGEEEKGEEPVPVKKDEDDLDYTSEEEEIIIAPKNFTELDRLGYVVRAVESNCHLMPIGALKLIPLHELRRNESFHGLDKDELGVLSKYVHFRNAQSEEKKQFIEKGDAIFYNNFLDPIEEDQPRGTWSIHLDSSKTLATIRNLLWQGYVAFHQANTTQFGSLYIGNGIKNKDLPFML